MLQVSPSFSVETRQSWVIAGITVLLLACSFGAPWITVVALKTIAAEVGGARSGPSLAVALAWFGSGLGGIAMGRIAERVGVRWTVAFGATMICFGLAISTFGPGWPIFLGHGMFIGLIGLSGINAPLYIYVSRWFDRRRGSALALISSGTYVAGALWPPIFERAIAAYGWRTTMLVYGVVTSVIIVTLSLAFLRPPPDETPLTTAQAARAASDRSVLGWPPNVVFGMLLGAIFLCCVTMSMPQSHLVAFCTDLGISASSGAAMLSVLLGTAFLSRQVWGLISDRIGGLHTIIICSTAQLAAMAAFLLIKGEAGLFAVSAAFGLGFSGLIPAYVLAARELFPASEAAWRIPMVLLCSGAGMATGGWLAGYLYDTFGHYDPAFATGMAFNLANLAVVAVLVARHHLAPARA
ncbi:MAG: MFS transporter [Rhizobiales bacterium]|nr:MFS transporter [Hyphomicrobiales bacterium]